MNRTHLDLFSGFGGFALAAKWCGLKTIAFSEIDAYASKILARNFPGVPNLGDIRTANWALFRARVDLVTGGFPCQPFSVAGKRRGAADDRHLWPAMLRVIGCVRPAWVLAENVPGIIGMVLDEVCADLESIGFWVQPIVVPACAVDAPHRRERVWIVANSNGSGLEEREEKPARKEFLAIERRCETVPDSRCRGGEWERNSERGEQESVGWEPEPGVGRMADGVPNRVDRLRGLGNSIVPQVAAEIIKTMMLSDSATK